MPYKDPIKRKKYFLEWQRKNRVKVRAYYKKYYDANSEEVIRRNIIKNKSYYHKLRVKSLEFYGGKCVCCGEDKIEFLGIDHISGGGNTHRKELKKQGLNIYEFLRKNKYPKGFQVLCHNCNLAKGFYGKCPHIK